MSKLARKFNILFSINQISKFLDYISHHFIELYTRRDCGVCNRHLFSLDIVKCVDSLLLEQLPLCVIVAHVLNQLWHVNESIPGIHHVLNNEFNESNLTLRDRARSPVNLNINTHTHTHKEEKR